MKKLGRIYVINSQRIYPSGFFEALERAFKGGAEVFQLRLKGVPRSEIVQVGKRVRKITRKYGVTFIVNDDPLIAREVEADGVHVGKGDFRVTEARQILGSEKIIGASSYDDIERALALQEEGADYVGFSSPFSSPTKPDKPITPPEVIREAASKLSIPIYVIGGVTDENVLEVLKLGVYGVAVISYAFDRGDPYENVKRLREKVYRYFEENPQ